MPSLPHWVVLLSLLSISLTGGWQLSRMQTRSLVTLTGLQAIRNRPTLKDWEARAVDNKHRISSKGKNAGGSSSSSANSRHTGTDPASDVVESDAEVVVDGVYASTTTGLVLERYGDRLLVELEGNVSEPIVCCQRSKMIDSSIVVGDIVNILLPANNTTISTTHNATAAAAEVVSNNEFQGIVTSHEPRTTLLQRPVTSGSGNGIRQMKAIAANVNQVMVVVAASPHVPPSSIDRILVAAHEYGMDATIVLNKVDDVEGTALLRRQLEHYPRIGYPVLEVSVSTNLGMESLKSHLKGKCSIFVGQSGVGKSSLVNSLLPNVQQRTGALVKNVNIGSHTTSSARLFHLDEGGTLIDSPGIRELGVWHLPVESIKAGFTEIVALAKECKFRNCQHHEDSLGCAVQRAIKQGNVSESRLYHFLSFTGQ